MILLRVASEQTDDREIDLPCDRWAGQERHALLLGGRRDALASDVDLEVGELGQASRQDEDGFISLAVCDQETNGGMGLCQCSGRIYKGLGLPTLLALRGGGLRAGRPNHVLPERQENRSKWRTMAETPDA